MGEGVGIGDPITNINLEIGEIAKGKGYEGS